ncbi:MAG: FdtA/QdtA family cupin domain-containing protein [Oscillospiraceae bacterium]|nr:FdtA/QdtA family cupin domain-containing protein [Oscillospiraceae bacterium]
MNIDIIDIKTITTEKEGQLSFFEADKDFDFDIKRIYYITKVSEGVKRGAHAHKNLKQLIWCPIGSVKIYLDNIREKREIILDNPAKGLVIKESVWRDMLWLKSDSVLCVAASDYYDADDYIRDYDEFIKYAGGVI